MKLYIGGIPYRMNEDDVRDMFTPYGDVSNVRIITDRETGRSKGFGFVEMENDDNAKAAIKELHEADLEGRSITVNEARPVEERTGGNSSYGGNRNGSSNNGRGGNSYGKSIDGRRW